VLVRETCWNHLFFSINFSVHSIALRVEGDTLLSNFFSLTEENKALIHYLFYNLKFITMKNHFLRCSFILLFLFLVPLLTYARMECTGACISGCITWSISYETDCNCGITEYDSIHYMGNIAGFPVFQYMNQISNPEFVGMNVTALGCDCNRCT
jgi:hypothetical protein